MLRPVSIAAGACILASYSGLASYARQSNAVSEEAATVAGAVRQIFNDARGSEALSGAKSKALDELAMLAEDCAAPGWDGYGALAVNQRALILAEQLISALPEGLQVPEVGAEPDGSISLDWMVSRGRVLSVSVGEGNRLAYAWLFGADREHGVIGFDGAQVPGRLIQKILYITDNTDASIRAA